MGLLADNPTDVTYFTDCVRDEVDPGDAQARMRLAVGRELGLPVGEFVRVTYPGDGSDVAMTLVSVLHGNEPSTASAPLATTMVLNNASPRAETYTHSPQGPTINGRKICATVVNGRTLVISTLSGGFFSLAHRLGLIGDLYMFEAAEVLLEWAVPQGLMSHDQAKDMLFDPFRGASYIPWLAGAILDHGYAMPHAIGDLGEPVSPRGVVARLDTRRFGPNVYLDVLTTDLDVDWESGRDTILLSRGQQEVRCYPSFAQIPPGELGAVPASSRYGPHKFVMIAVQGGSAYDRLSQLGIVLNLGRGQVLHPSAIRKPASALGVR